MGEPISLDKAILYEKYRLPYAPQLVDDLLEQTGGAEIVADIGAGTGQLARLFAAKCRQVYAVEPDASMRKVASEALADYPNISIIDACAEQTTLPDSSIDLIVIGNAFHRFRPEAVEELLRILKTAGWIALISYSFTDKSFTDMLFSSLGRLESIAARSAKTWHRVPVETLFRDQPMRTLQYPQSLREDWEAFWGAARSGVEAPEPDDEDFAPFRRINREVFEALAKEGRICIEYETRVLFGRPKR